MSFHIKDLQDQYHRASRRDSSAHKRIGTGFQEYVLLYLPVKEEHRKYRKSPFHLASLKHTFRCAAFQNKHLLLHSGITVSEVETRKLSRPDTLKKDLYSFFLTAKMPLQKFRADIFLETLTFKMLLDIEILIVRKSSGKRRSSSEKKKKQMLCIL